MSDTIPRWPRGGPSATAADIMAAAHRATREEILEWCLWCDRNGVYTDANNAIEYPDRPPLTREDALECVAMLVAD